EISKSRIDVARARCPCAMDLQADLPSHPFHLHHFGLGPRKRRIDYHGDGTNLRYKIADQFKPLRCHLGCQQAYAGQICSRPAETLDETTRNWVCTAGKDDWDGGSGLLRGPRR